MALADWSIALGGGYAQSSLTTASLFGAKSLLIAIPGTGVGSGAIDVVVAGTSAYAKGLTTGRLRCAFKADGTMDASHPARVFGLFWLASDPTPMQTVGCECYGVLVEYNRLTLRKQDSSTILSAATILQQSAVPYTSGTLVTLQAQWEPVDATHVRLQVWRGSLLTYSDLVPVWDYTDSAAFTTSTCEGVCMRQGDTGGTNLGVTVDRTALYHPAP
jgi:hypothetical protein